MKRTVAIFAFLLFIAAAHGQTKQGVPQYGSFQSFGFGSVNLQNLNFNFTLPLATSPGRGMNLNFGISYNSSIWVPDASWTPTVNASGQATWGWNLTSPIGSIPYEYTYGTCVTIPHEQIEHTTSYSNYSYVEPNGTAHPFSVFYTMIPSGCPGAGTYGTSTGYATDGSGYYINIASRASPIVYTPSGSQITATSLKDTNGNSITATVVNSSETDWTDSSGRVALKIISSGSSSIQYQVLTPTGTYDTTTLSLTSQNIKTAFGCSGVGEYTGTVSLPYSISLSSGATYYFAYESSGTSTVTGRLAYIDLAGGGVYRLQFSGGPNDGINCSDGSGTSTSVLSSGTLTGDWAYSRAQSGGNWQTTVTMPDIYTALFQDQAVYTFNTTGQELSHLIYEGNVSGGTLMRQVNTVWASNGSPQSRTSILEDGKTALETDTTFDAYGNLTTLVERNWGTTSSAGPALRTTNLSYLYSGPNGSTYLSENILDRVLTKTLSDQNNIVQYNESIGYDSPSGLNTPCITGAPQHDDTNYGCSFTARGLMTSDTIYANAAAQSGAQTKNFTYDSLGNLRTAQVDCCQEKKWNYSVTTQYTFPDSVVSGSGTPSLTTSYTYNAYTGQVATSTDENGKVTSYTNDVYGRPLTITRPDMTVVTYSYDDVHEISSVSIPISGSLARVQQTTVDSLGRPVVTSLLDATGVTYSSSSTSYDSFNRAFQTSTPNNGGTQYFTKTQYDVLGRITTLTAPDGAITNYSYSTNTTTVTDPSGKSRKTAADGIGRVITVFEPDATNNNLLTQQTSYTYTVLDAIAGVSQGAQTRSNTYDGIGRLTNSSTPEAGVVSYQYNSFDLVTQRTDARGVITNYYYDPLNRLAGLAYTLPQGSTVSPMPNSCTASGGQPANVCYFYDQGGAAANALGRLTETIDPTGSETPTYDILGHTTKIQKVINGITYPILYGYNLGNEITSITYPSGRVVTQNVDAIGRLSSVSDKINGINTTYASGLTYNAASQVTGFSYGNGVSASFTYSPDRLQLTALNYVGAGQPLFSLNYWYKQDPTSCPTGTASNNGQIQCITDSVDTGRSVSYSYDPTARLATGITNGSAAYAKWGLTWTYDRYGNRTAQTVTAGSAPSNALMVSQTTNQITTAGFLYDLSGNTTNDGLNTLVYDALNRETSSAGSLGSDTYSYDGHGLRVSKSSGSTSTVYLFAGANAIAEYVNGAAPASPTREYIYGASGLLAKVEAGGTQYYYSDHRSVRMMADSNGNILGQQGHYPYGESWYARNTTTKWQFNDYERDSESNNDYATARYYVNRNGRFSSTDPFGGSMTDPQRLNRYSYVENDPGNNSDPSGMFTLPFLGNSILGFLEGGLDGQCTEDGVDASCGSLGPLIASGGADSISGNSALLATGQGVNLGSSNEFDFLTLPVVLQGGYVGVHVSFNAGPTPGGWMEIGYTVFTWASFGQPGNGFNLLAYNPTTPSSPIPSSWQEKMHDAAHYLCGKNAGDRVVKSVLGGAAVGAATGGVAGFLTGEVFGGEVTFGATGLPGAYIGAHVGAAVGAANGLTTGVVLSTICSAGFMYDN